MTDVSQDRLPAVADLFERRLHDNMLVRADAAMPAREHDRLLHSERYFGRVSRAFRLGQEIDEARASAKYADGVLELTLPKKAGAVAKQLTVQ